MFAVKEPPAPGPSSFLFRSKDFNRDLDILAPSLPLNRSLDLPVCLARFPSARLWLKDESLEDSANLPDPDIIAAEIDSQNSLCSPFGLPVHVVRSRHLRCRRSPSRPRPLRPNHLRSKAVTA